jgi:hypothetical protein
MAECVYCGGSGKCHGSGLYHPYVKDHGPFDIYLCSECHSLFTFPLPSAGSLASLYSSFDGGMYGDIARLRKRYPLNGWYKQCESRMVAALGKVEDGLSWIDLGSGDGVMSERMKRAYPSGKGWAVDVHTRPERLKDVDVTWVQADLNEGAPDLPKAKLVFAVTVLEHVTDPCLFIGSGLDLLDEGGVFYFNCPRADCMAFRLMGRKWPYYLPGEHITVPTMKGLSGLVNRLAGSRPGRKFSIEISPVTMPYPFGYYLGFLTGNRWMPDWQLPIYLPTGLLECTIRRLC